MKFRYVFEDPRNAYNESHMWIIDYAEIKGTQLVFNDKTDYTRHKIVDMHQYLFTTSDNIDVYEYDWIKVCRGDSLRDHISQVMKGRNGGAYIYHNGIEQLTGNGYEEATLWMRMEPSINSKEPNVYFHESWEECEGEDEE